MVTKLHLSGLNNNPPNEDQIRKDLLVQMIFENEDYAAACSILSVKGLKINICPSFYDKFLKGMLIEASGHVDFVNDPTDDKRDHALLKLVRIAEFLKNESFDSACCRLSLAAAYLKMGNKEKLITLLPELLQIRGFRGLTDLMVLNSLIDEKGAHCDYFFVPLREVLESSARASAVGISLSSIKS